MADEQPADINTEPKACVVFNGKKLQPTISELLGINHERWGEFTEMKKRHPDWIWFHLPFVSKGLLSILFHKLVDERMVQNGVNNGGKVRDEIISFLNETFAGKKIVDFPRSHDSLGGESATFSVAMKCLDSEDSEIYDQSDNRTTLLPWAPNVDEEVEAGNWLPSRTLDESFYVTSNNETSVNHDQVVYRYYERHSDNELSGYGSTSSHGQTRVPVRSRILMVNPLRLWKIGSGKIPNDEAPPKCPAGQAHMQQDVVVTAFPASYKMCPDYYDPQFTTFGNICQSVINDLPRSAMELVSKIMASLVTAVDGPYYAGLNESLLTIFESETSAQTARQLEFYKNFQRLVTSRTRPRSMKSRSKASVEGPRARRDATNSESDHSGSENQSPTALETINDEVECFRVIMDIRDELSMISSVFSEQEQVIQSVMNSIKKPIPPKGSDAHATRYVDPTTDQLKGAESEISLWKKRISNIDQRAQVVEKSLGHLLSLKLEVSNFALQVKADKQSSLLFAFTVVTVLYAPMSFVTSFFAIPSRDFPQDGGVSWNQSQIGGGLAISLVVTIVLVVLTVMFNNLFEKKSGTNNNRNKNEKDDKNGNDGKKSNKGKKTMEMSMA